MARYDGVAITVLRLALVRTSITEVALMLRKSMTFARCSGWRLSRLLMKLNHTGSKYFQLNCVGSLWPKWLTLILGSLMPGLCKRLRQSCKCCCIVRSLRCCTNGWRSEFNMRWVTHLGIDVCCYWSCNADAVSKLVRDWKQTEVRGLMWGDAQVCHSLKWSILSKSLERIHLFLHRGVFSNRRRRGLCSYDRTSLSSLSRHRSRGCSLSPCLGWPERAFGETSYCWGPSPVLAQNSFRCLRIIR